MTQTTIATVYSEFSNSSKLQTPCQLVVVDGPEMGKALPIGLDKLLVGTDPDCTLTLTDQRVSSRHMTIEPVTDGFSVTDLDSKNGTLFEGSLISRTLVSPGATLKVGHTFLRIQPQPRSLEIAPSQSRKLGDMVAQSLSMREVFAVIEQVSKSSIPLLIEGETGTGKELTARAIHEYSDRRRGPFVTIDCGALPRNLLESEFFGHVRGAYTGASANRAGAFVRAKGGTLFLDELDTVPQDVQALLLRAVEEGKIRPVGSDRERDVDVRVVSASRQDISTQVAEGLFRPDLFYRLVVVKISLPPLRERREDLPLLVTELLKRRGLNSGPVSGPNLNRLMAHSWPGNIRELRNVLDRALVLSPGPKTFENLNLSLQPQKSERGLTIRTDLSFGEAKKNLIDHFEKKYLQDLLERCPNNLSKAAREAQLDRKHLRTLLQKHNITVTPKS